MGLQAGEIYIDDSNYVMHLYHPESDQHGPSYGKGRDVNNWRSMVGEDGVCGPGDIPLIDRAEWDDRIEEMEKTQTRISDTLVNATPYIPSLDQNGTNYCHTADTEVLTDRGWAQWPDYNWKDLLGTMNVGSGLLEFQRPLAKHVYHHKGETIHSTNRCVDFGITPDHRLLVRKWDANTRKLSKDYTFQRAGDMGFYFGLPPSTSGHIGTDLIRVQVEDDREYEGDDFARLMSLIISDGYAGSTDKTRDWVSFASFREELRPMIERLASRTGFHEMPSRRGVWVRYGAGALANWVRNNCYTGAPYRSHTKRVPPIIKEMSSRQIRIFLDTYGDQSYGMEQGHAYFSTSKRCIDDLQELLLRVGKRGTVYSDENQEGRTATLENGEVVNSRRTMWHLHERARDALSIDRKKHIERDSYNGLVYCATVPNSTLVTRRNGTILISGNCWCNAVVGCVQAIRCLNGLDYEHLSPASVAGPIKNYANQGGWGGEALKFIIDHGICPVNDPKTGKELWAPNARDHSLRTQYVIDLAKNYRVTQWYELESRNFDQMMSLLFQRIPVACGYSWWSHEVMLCDPVRIAKGQYGARFRNSWSDSFGTKGFAVLSQSKATPDDACAPTVQMAMYGKTV